MTTGTCSMSTNDHIQLILLIMYTTTQATTVNGTNKKLTIMSAPVKTHKDHTVVWVSARGLGKRTSGLKQQTAHQLSQENLHISEYLFHLFDGKKQEKVGKGKEK